MKDWVNYNQKLCPSLQYAMQPLLYNYFRKRVTCIQTIYLAYFEMKLVEYPIFIPYEETTRTKIDFTFHCFGWIVQYSRGVYFQFSSRHLWHSCIVFLSICSMVSCSGNLIFYFKKTL